jgi:hypothetical protein
VEGTARATHTGLGDLSGQLWEQVSAESQCTHAQRALRCRTIKNSTRQYVMQCLRCGHVAETLRKSTLTPNAMASALPFDETRCKDWHARMMARLDALGEADNQAWWARYERYLKTPLRWCSNSASNRRSG